MTSIKSCLITTIFIVNYFFKLPVSNKEYDHNEYDNYNVIHHYSDFLQQGLNLS